MKNLSKNGEKGRIGVLLLVLSVSAFLSSCSRASDVFIAPFRSPDAEKPVETTSASEAVKPVETPNRNDTEQIVREFGDRDPAVREAAIRRLLPHPQTAAGATVQSFVSGNLSTRLAALELLREWGAPVDGFDPWLPETFTPQRLADLEAWQKTEAEKPADPVRRELTEEQRAEAADDIRRMLHVTETEAGAIRERLARWGDALLPMVYDRLKSTVSDEEQRRLQALRYRLVAAESLPRRWPDGLLRLASPEIAIRQKAAEELASLASAEDQPLLRELFSDPSPLVRELCLRGLQKTGGEAQTMLLELLDDPEPNVRAAVLKQLEEKPTSETGRRIAEYVRTETDSDLVGHAVRVLRVLYRNNDPKATLCLVDLLKHESWQVRSEAAAALGSKDTLTPSVSSALVELLDDKDGFVVSKGVEAMENLDTPAAVEPLVKAIGRNPDLAGQVVKILLGGSNMNTKAIPLLRPLCKHEDPRIRAAVVGALPAEEKEITAALADSDSRVRIAAAKSLFQLLDSLRKTSLNRGRGGLFSEAVTVTRTVAVHESPGLISGIARLFGVTGTPKRPEAVVATVEAVDLTGEEATVEPEPPQEGDAEVTKTKMNQVDALRREIASNSAMVTTEANDQWLRDFYTGKNRPGWTTALTGRLETMLAAESAEERITAAAVLVPLGKPDEMTVFLMDATKDKPEFFDSFVQIIPWLVREKRLELLERWRSANRPDDDQIPRFLNQLVVPPDLRNEPLLWDILDGEDVSVELISNVFRNLKPLYLFDRFAYSHNGTPPKEVRDELVDKLLARADAGSESQRLVAVAILITLDIDRARETAEKFDGDESLSDEFRRDMFQVRLLTQPNKKAASEFAVETLKRKEPARSRLALRALLNEDTYTFRILRGRIYLNLPSGFQASFGGSDIRQVPRGLDAEAVRPLLDDKNDEIAAYAGYFSVLLNNPAGLEPLLKYWRKIRGDSEEDNQGLVGRLLGRAIAARNDSGHISVLREIYEKLDASDVKDFYWTIRGMTGSEILKFRKEIRDRYGALNLM